MSSRLTVYKASAGSGKTFTLAVQYIKLLIETPASASAYRHILAVTFTNKATGEMKDRILGQLYGLWKGIPSSDGYLQALKRAIADEGGTPPPDDEIRERAGKALLSILHDYNRFRVETIDSFFQSVLKNLAHELNLTANLQVDLADKEMLAHAVDRIMDRLHLDPRTLAWIMDYVDERIAGDERWDVTREVKAFATHIFRPAYLQHADALRAALDDDKRINAYRHALRDLRDEALDTLLSAVAHFREELEAHGIACTDFSRGATLNTYLRELEEKHFAAEWKQTLQNYVDDADKMLVAAKRKDPDWVQAAQHFQGLLQELRTFQLSLSAPYHTASLALKHLNPLRLLHLIDEEVTALTTETNRFLLARTPILLNDLIDESDAPFIFERMGTEFRHVMIDEFQDTSTLQWRNFKSLLLENLATGGCNLLVGDVKQSIYRWRNGDWTILNNIAREMRAQHPDIRHLDTNYRSARRIIEFNNRLFTVAAARLDALRPEAPMKLAEAYADVCQQCPPGRPEEGLVRVKFYKSTRGEDNDWEQEMLTDLADQVEALHTAGLPYKEMAILLRQRSHAAPIIDYFATRLPHAKLVSDEAFLLSASTGIQMLVAAMRLLLDADDRVSAAYLALHYVRDVRHRPDTVADVLTGEPRQHLPEAFTGAVERLRLLPLYELQEELYRLFSLHELEGQDGYFFTYFDKVTEFLADNPSDLRTFLTYWDEQLCRQSIPGGEVDGIRIFTIHKSKGLQFHTVLAPYCHWAIEKDRALGGGEQLLWCEPHEAPYDELPLLPIAPGKAMKESAFSAEYEEEHLQQRVDSLNMLYVALTRAEKNLLVWCRTKEALHESSTVGDLLYEALPTDIPGADFDEEMPATYTYGEPVGTAPTKTEEADNRMELHYVPQPVRMTSHAADIEFRQSTRSEQFIRQSGDEAEGDEGGTSTTQEAYIQQGKLLHYIFSALRTEADLPALLRQVEDEGILGSHVRREQVERWVRTGLQRPEVADWFSGRYELFNECSILVPDEKGSYHTRRPDRVMVSEDEIVVTDFKFGRPRPEYHEQVREYMELLRRMQPTKRIRGFLWYVYINKVEEII